MVAYILKQEPFTVTHTHTHTRRKIVHSYITSKAAILTVSTGGSLPSSLYMYAHSIVSHREWGVLGFPVLRLNFAPAFLSSSNVVSSAIHIPTRLPPYFSQKLQFCLKHCRDISVVQSSDSYIELTQHYGQAINIINIGILAFS